MSIRIMSTTDLINNPDKKVELKLGKFPYQHEIYNPDGPKFEGSVYDKIILESEYSNLIKKQDGAKEVDAILEREISNKIYLEFNKYLNQKNSNTPILRELIENYIGTKLVQVRMNKVLYNDGVMKLQIKTNPKGELYESYTKHVLLKDFNEINAMSMSVLAKINEIISGIKVEVVSKTTSIHDLMAELDGDVIDAEVEEKD